MKSCVIFSCTIVKPERLIVLHKFIESFKQNFSDADFFIGINPNSVNEVEDIISSTGLNIISMNRATNELYSESDASAYQIALKGLLNSNNSYENYSKTVKSTTNLEIGVLNMQKSSLYTDLIKWLKTQSIWNE